MEKLAMRQLIDWLDSEWEINEDFHSDLYHLIRERAEELAELEEKQIANTYNSGASRDSILYQEIEGRLHTFYNNRHKD